MSVWHPAASVGDDASGEVQERQQTRDGRDLALAVVGGDLTERGAGLRGPG